MSLSQQNGHIPEVYSELPQTFQMTVFSKEDNG